MFDVTCKRSFESLNNWLAELRKFGLNSNNTTLVVVGNKIDKYQREVTEQEGTSFAIERSLTYFEASANSGVGVEDVIDYALADTLKRGFYK